MASLLVVDSGRPTIEIQWDWSRVLGTEIQPGSAIVLTGREVVDYARALKETVRASGGKLVEDRFYVEAILRRVDSVRGSVSLELTHTVDDRISGRYVIAQRKEDVSTWDVEEYHRKLLYDDKYFRDISKLNVAIDSAVSAFDEGVVIYPSSVSYSSYFRLLLPLIIKRCSNARWIIVSSGRANEFPEFEHVEREYIDRSDAVGALSQIFRLDTDSIESILSSDVDYSRYKSRSRGLTESEFLGFIKWAHNAVRGKAGGFLPSVPLAEAAPIEFDIRKNRITATDEKVSTNIRAPLLEAILSELIIQVDDVPNHFNLHNAAPACNAKLMRVRDHLREIRDDGISEARILTLGIRSQACREHLRFEVENLDRAAEGAIHTALAQIEAFLARFPEWRGYVQDGEAGGADKASGEDIDSAIVVLSGFNNAELLDEKGSVAVSRALYEAKSDATTGVEKRGVLKIIHNLVSKAFAGLKDAISSDWKKHSASIFYSAMARIVIALEPAFISLAEHHPVMFGWTTAFVGWVKTFAAK